MEATTVSTPSRLTRSALKKLNSERENVGSQSKSPVAARKALFADDATDRLVQDYEAFQQGLGPVKRRRVASSQHDGANQDDVENVPPTDNIPAVNAVSPQLSSHGASEGVEVVLWPELQLAEAEKKLDGAPEGDLYVVTVLSSSEISASEDVAVELAAVHEVLDAKAAGASTSEGEDISWAKEYAALDSLRRFALHHSGQLQPMLEQCLTTLVCPAAANLRSAMARNALLCLQDMLNANCGVESHFRHVIPLLVHRMGNEKQFIRDLARDVLSSCVDKYASGTLLLELLRVGTGDKNAQIVGSAGVFASKCILKMDAADLKRAIDAHESFVADMDVFLHCKVVDCKLETRKTLQHVRKILGDAEFIALVKSKLEGTAQFDMLKASEVKKAPSHVKSGLPKLSMRERMLLMKKKQGEASDIPSADVVVVAEPPPASR